MGGSDRGGGEGGDSGGGRRERRFLRAEEMKNTGLHDFVVSRESKKKTSEYLLNDPATFGVAPLAVIAENAIRPVVSIRYHGKMSRKRILAISILINIC